MTQPRPEPMILSIPGGGVHALAWGDPDAPGVLALHGWLDNAESFRLLAPELSSYRVVALDLPGHGHSFHRAQDSHYYFLDYVADVVACADMLEWQTFGIVGHSMGASIGALLAGTFPERVTGLGMIDNIAPLTAEPFEAPTRLRKSIEGRESYMRREPKVYASMDEAVSSLLRVAKNLSEDVARTMVARSMLVVKGGYVWRTDRRLRGVTPLRLTVQHVECFLRGITAPACVVWAKDGLHADPKLNQHYEACLANLSVVHLEGGHHVHLEHPALTAQAFGGLFDRRKCE